jgi:hypothetical protein
MTFSTMVTAASSTEPMWPTKPTVTKPMENWKTAVRMAGKAMCHSSFDSCQLLLNAAFPIIPMATDDEDMDIASWRYIWIDSIDHLYLASYLS